MGDRPARARAGRLRPRPGPLNPGRVGRPRVLGPGLAAWARLDQRATGYAPRSAVAVTLKPEQLPGRLPQLDQPQILLPALAALPEAAEAVDSYDLSRSPIGAVGCELATSVPVTAPDSPLRLLLRSPLPFSRRDALLLRRKLRKLPVRVEAELETRHGAVSLAEYSTSPQSLTLHTPDGPRLVGDPWLPPRRRLPSATRHPAPPPTAAGRRPPRRGPDGRGNPGC
nr:MULTISPECIES: phosphoribosyl-dephospho-CoA transferase MdcG domain-containing protein [unclassified Kitasatospora]